MADIFLSYAREDREKAAALVHALKTQGWSVWWDMDIPAGMRWGEVIDTELARARCVIVLWSEQSIQSNWIHEEAYVALERGILLPVLV